MKKPMYHCSNHPEEIQREGIVKPARMDSVYLFENVDDVMFYMKEFSYKAFFTVDVDAIQIMRKWKASYGTVIRLKPGETVPIIATHLYH